MTVLLYKAHNRDQRLKTGDQSLKFRKFARFAQIEASDERSPLIVLLPINNRTTEC